jgi:hypothetical protein
MSGSRLSAPGEAVAPQPPPADADPVGMTVHGMPGFDAALAAQRTRAGRRKMLLVLAVCAAPVIASYLMYYVVRPQARTNYAELIQPTRSLPAALPLTTLAGSAVDPASLRRQWLLIVVSPAACPAACQERLLMQRQLHQMLGKERGRVDKIWLVTDDTMPDSALLAGLTQGEDPSQVLRVERRELEGWLAPAAGSTLDEHLYIVDPMGEWMMRAPVNPQPQKLKRDLERLLRASGWWDVAGR